MNIFLIPGKRLQVDLFIDFKTIFVFILPEAGEKQTQHRKDFTVLLLLH